MDWTPVINLLFTSVGRRVELMRAFRDAFRSGGFEGRIVATDVDPLAPALQEVDAKHLVPRTADPEFVPTLLEICRRESITAVFPLIDPDIPRLASRRPDFESVGTRLGIVSAEAAEICNDKWLTYEFFNSRGIPTPRTWLPGSRVPENDEYPVFVKPRRGSASEMTFKARDRQELEFFQRYVPDAVVQEWLPGPEITTDVICNLESDILAVVSRRRIAVRGGEVVKGVTIFDAPIDSAAREIASALPAIGPITVQCIMKEGAPHFIEINARLGGGIPLAIAAGVDVPRLLLASLSTKGDAPNPISEYKTGLYLTRFDESYFLDQPADEPTTSDRL